MSRINGMMRIHQSALTKIDKSQVKRLCDLDTKNSQQDTPKLEPFETRHKGFLLQQEKLMEKERGAVSKLVCDLQSRWYEHIVHVTTVNPIRLTVFASFFLHLPIRFLPFTLSLWSGGYITAGDDEGSRRRAESWEVCQWRQD